MIILNTWEIIVLIFFETLCIEPRNTVERRRSVFMSSAIVFIPPTL